MNVTWLIFIWSGSQHCLQDCSCVQRILRSDCARQTGNLTWSAVPLLEHWKLNRLLPGQGVYGHIAPDMGIRWKFCFYPTFPRKRRYSLGAAGLGGSVGCASDWLSRVCGFDPRRVGSILSWRFDHEIFSTVILSLSLIQEGQLSVSDERMCTMVKRLED